MYRHTLPFILTFLPILVTFKSEAQDAPNVISIMENITEGIDEGEKVVKAVRSFVDTVTTLFKSSGDTAKKQCAVTMDRGLAAQIESLRFAQEADPETGIVGFLTVEAGNVIGVWLPTGQPGLFHGVFHIQGVCYGFDADLQIREFRQDRIEIRRTPTSLPGTGPCIYTGSLMKALGGFYVEGDASCRNQPQNHATWEGMIIRR